MSVDSDNMQFHGDVEFGDGSASSPSITNVGDTNTGIFFPNANEVGVSADATHVASFKTSGLEVKGTVKSQTLSGKDTLVVSGGDSGSSSYELTLKPNTLTANRTITFPDQGGVVALAGQGGGGGSSTSVSNDTTTNSDSFFPVLSNISSGTLTESFVSSTKMYYNPSSGQLTATNFNSLSDARSKENIQSLSDCINMVSRMRGVSFNWKDSGQKSIGVIAQELETVLPEAVHTGESGIKTVSYGLIIGVLIEAIKEQQKQIDELTSLVNK